MKDYTIILTERKEICENTYAFSFDIKNTNYKFEAGQYAHFTLSDVTTEDGKGKSRPFSIASSPHNKDSIMIAARKGSSVFIDSLLSIPAGSEVFLSNPSGNLTLNKNEFMDNVFIAGGIGITPVRSIVEYALYKNLKNKITLFYSNKTESQTAFINDLEEWAQENYNFKFIPTIEDIKNIKWKYEFGKIDADMLKKYLDDFKNKQFYLIGPPVMVESIKEILLKEKVPEANIKTEKFK